MSISASQIVETLTQLAHDAMQLGATAVTVQLDNPGNYYFSAHNRKYVGKLHPTLISQVTPLLHASSRISLTCEHELIAKLYLSTSKIVSEKNFTISWDLQTGATANDLSASTIAEVPLKESSQSKLPLNANPHQALILLVEDDVRFASILKSILVDKGWRAEIVTNGNSALTRIRDHSLESPALVVCDVHMPGIDGITFVSTLRSEKAYLPILMLTSDDNRILEVELALLGVDAFIKKQDDPRVLIAWINNLLTRDSRLQKRFTNGHSVTTSVFSQIPDAPAN